MENISISLSNYFEQFVNNQVSDGKYKNIDEVIQAGLSLLEKEDETLALKTAIFEGLNSPRVENFDFKENLKQLKEELVKNG